MAVQLASVVPFGRSLDEYCRMFNLSAADLSGRVLGVGDGPASFNAEATQQGMIVVSVDPIYSFSKDEILERFNAVVDTIIEQVSATADDYVWDVYQSPEGLRAQREQVLHRFLDDYELGKQQGRYYVGSLPHLDFADQSFDLALCSHLLFLYSDHLDYDFHRRALHEMLRVSREVRLFPLLTMMLERSPHLDPLLEDLASAGYRTNLVRVAYEFQKGGHTMLQVSH
ncbi:MAG TPA: class I SAM-dependent methyltransferase [Stenomitos sp.]